jgi:TonB family protein
MLEQVVVQRKSMKYTGRLAGYYERLQRRSSGQFLTREDFDRNESLSLSQLIARSPGVNSVRLRSGGGAVRMRGRACRPLVWMDGVPMPAGEVDLDAFPVSTLHGAEVYLGSTTAPIDYTAQQNRSSCGTILLWSRGRDTEISQRSARSSVDLDSLVSSLAVYTADQVDVRTELKSNDHLNSAYPPELFALGAGGTVVAEFVVDASGRLERNTFAVVSTTHQLLSAAVARALAQSTFVPAVKDGKRVRQFVRQRFDFGPRG